MFDVALVLGSGIKANGELANSSKSAVEKAVELLKEGEVSNLVFSGKWAWSLDYTPPLTEAEAMSLYAQSLGCSPDKIVTENTSVTTVSNLCLVKTEILLKKGWRKIVLIDNEPCHKRALLNMNKVLGPGFATKVVVTGFRYSDEVMRELKEAEGKKIQDAKDFYKDIENGDHETIYRLAMDDLKKNYATKK